MGLANSFLSGSKEEWSLVRRHPSESIFGIQVAGSKPQNLVSTAEVLATECGENIDFVDVNCGCPIDLVFNTGSGSARTSIPLLASIWDVLFSLRCTRPTRKNIIGNEPRTRCHTSDSKTKNWSQPKQHSSQAYATLAVRMECWMHYGIEHTAHLPRLIRLSCTVAHDNKDTPS